MRRSSFLSIGLLLSFGSGCEPEGPAVPRDGSPSEDGGFEVDAGPEPAPAIIATTPMHDVVDVPLNSSVGVTFTRAMEAASFDATTFTVMAERATTPVEGTFVARGSGVYFRPTAMLPADTTFIATVTTGAMSAAGNALEEEHTWTFTTGSTEGLRGAVDLGEAGNFAILAKMAIGSTRASQVIGDVGLSPAPANLITGFALRADPTNIFATSPQVTGRVYASNYATPTPTTMSAAVTAMERAFVEAGERAPDLRDLAAGELGGLTLGPGVYVWSTGVWIPSNVTLTGSATDQWIFRVGGDLTMSGAATVRLTGGARAENVLWQVGGLVSIAADSHCEGNILAETSFTMGVGASVTGRVMTQTAIVLEESTISLPAE